MSKIKSLVTELGWNGAERYLKKIKEDIKVNKQSIKLTNNTVIPIKLTGNASYKPYDGDQDEY